MAPVLRNFLVLLGIITLVSFLVSVVLAVLIAEWINNIYRRREWYPGRTWYAVRRCRRYW
ncbi:MAG: hypothetical protein ACPLRU_06950 [Desulfofundulus sp.]